MSKRGNPDYFKLDGHPAKDPNLDEMAKRRFAESRRVWLRGPARFSRPEPPVRAVVPPPAHDGERPWRVHLAPPLVRRSFAARCARLLSRAVLAPAHAVLSIADALVERALWRLEKQL